MKYTHIIKQAIVECLQEGQYPLITFELAKPKDLKHGDYATNVAFKLAKEMGTDALSIGNDLKKRLSVKLADCVDRIEIVNDYINFFFTEQVLQSIVLEAILSGDTFCSGFVDDKRLRIVEFSSPNIAKPFTVGHLRSTIIGDSLARLLKHAGCNVLKDNHIGDWGTQFGKMTVAIKKWGDEKKLMQSSEPVKDLVALYVKFHQEAEVDIALEDEARAWFTRLENGDLEATRIWYMCVELSMVEFEKIYKRLNVSFDTTNGESFFQDKMDIVLQELREKNLSRIGEKGAELVFFDEDTKLPPLMVLKQDGSTLYATRDLATDRYRKETYGSDIVIINEVGGEQAEYFKQIFKTEELLGYFTKEQRVHVKHGLYKLKAGKMSTRAGNVILLENVLDDGLEEVRKEVQKVPGKTISDDDIQKIAIGAVKFYDLFRSCEKNIAFSLEEMLNLKGDTGPYVQYAVVKINSLIEKATEAGIYPDTFSNVSLGKPEIILAQKIDGFGAALEMAVAKYAPHYVAGYLIELAREYNSYYAKNFIIKENNVAGLFVSTAVASVLSLGLSLIGIEVPSEM